MGTFARLTMVCLFISLYFGYTYYSDLIASFNNIQRRLMQIESTQYALGEKIGVRSEQIYIYETLIKKQDYNFKAFNGTDCARCHLDVKNLLPLENKPLPSFADFRRVVRKGIKGKMPAYSNIKSTNDIDYISDAELKKMFKILIPD